MKKFGKILSLMLAIMMIVSCMSFYVFAADTVWNAADMSVDVVPGTEGYSFLSVYRKPGHAYEMSNHMVSTDGGANNDIPQTLVLVDASEEYTWTPGGKYVHGQSNYEVLYCCDAETGYEDGIYYKRLNLEDSEYYNADQAAHIRAIVTHSYPYVTLEQMKADLKAAGLEYADELTRAEIISAVQAAIWGYANDDVGLYTYSRTFDVPTNTQWGTVMHDYTNEMNVWWTTGKRKFSTDEATEKRVNGLTEYLMSLDKVAPAPEEIIISKLEILKTVPVVGKDGTFSTTLKIALNNSGSGEADTLKLDVLVDGVLAHTSDVSFGTSDYEVTVDARVGQKISAVVSGTQVLPVGAYFYAPEPADVDGDGVATSREVSQNLVGVASGKTPVYTKEEVYVPGETELTVIKNWDDDDNRDALRPNEVTVRLNAGTKEIASAVLNEENEWSHTFEGLAIYNESGDLINYTVTEDEVEGYEAVIEDLSVTNVHRPELTFVEVEKSWNDGDDRDALRPDEITVRLHANGIEVASQVLNAENGWSTKFDNLFKYENGEEIVYTITEDAVENYNPTVTETENGFAIENYYKPETTFVNVTKVWDDDGDRDGKRPDSVTVALLADGEMTEYTLVLNAENGFTGTFAELPVNRAGKKIEYTVTELDAAPYTATVTGDAVTGFNITNTYVPETVEVSGTKTWVDEDNADGIRPESITISLLANGEKIDSKTVTEKDGWAWTFEDLYKYENGEVIEYTVTEDAVDGYDSEIDGYNVTNTHIPEEVIEDDPIPLVPADKDDSHEDLVEIEDPEIPLAPSNGENAPQTGDGSVIALIAAAAAGVVLIAVMRKKRAFLGR